MTATRWWVRMAARWLARIDGVKGQIQAFSLAVTAFSTFSIMLQGFGMGEFVPYLGGVVTVIGIVYTYLYAEGGVWNQVNRDRHDMSDNYAAPGAYISSQIQIPAIAAAIEAAMEGDDPETAAEETVAKRWRQYRDGVELEEIEQ